VLKRTICVFLHLWNVWMEFFNFLLYFRHGWCWRRGIFQSIRIPLNTLFHFCFITACCWLYISLTSFFKVQRVKIPSLNSGNLKFKQIPKIIFKNIELNHWNSNNGLPVTWPLFIRRVDAR
jgi:hypothetical protein